MIVTLKYFGLIAELMQRSEERLELSNPLTVSDLRKLKEMDFPELRKTDYRVAANHQLTEGSFLIQQDCEVAFLPPFSGG